MKVLLCLAVAACASLAWAAEPVDLSVVHRIKAEAFANSKVMEHAFYLTDVHGPRLTNSPGYRQAAEWTAKQLTEYGLTSVKLEPWGPFGRSWNFTRFSAHLLEPQYAPLNGFPLAWTSGTNGPFTGEPVYAPIRTEADLPKYKGQLRGRIVLIDQRRDLNLVSNPVARRLTEADLSNIEQASDPATPIPQFYRDAAGNPISREAYMKWRAQLRDFLISEGVALVIQNSRGEGVSVYGQGGGSHELKDPPSPPTAVLAPEHYNRIVRLLEHKIPVKLEFDIQATTSDAPVESFNVIGEIPGGKKKDEVVILGAHLDSWHGSTGATDNASGVAVMMEAMRILKALNLPMDRTVRIALWSAEEQGLLGSRAYVKKHYADPETMKLTPEHSKVAGYFNYDNGAGKIRGIYLQGNDMTRPLFEAWLAPFRDYGVTTVTIRNTSSTDHISFDRVGIPGFQFIQDPLEYSTRTHHSSMDAYDRLQKSDLMQSAAVIAAVAYHAANRPELLPRKPLPKPEPKKPETKPEAKATSPS